MSTPWWRLDARLEAAVGVGVRGRAEDREDVGARLELRLDDLRYADQRPGRRRQELRPVSRLRRCSDRRERPGDLGGSRLDVRLGVAELDLAPRRQAPVRRRQVDVDRRGVAPVALRTVGCGGVDALLGDRQVAPVGELDRPSRRRSPSAWRFTTFVPSKRPPSAVEPIAAVTWAAAESAVISPPKTDRSVTVLAAAERARTPPFDRVVARSAPLTITDAVARVREARPGRARGGRRRADDDRRRIPLVRDRDPDRPRVRAGGAAGIGGRRGAAGGAGGDSRQRERRSPIGRSSTRLIVAPAPEPASAELAAGELAEPLPRLLVGADRDPLVPGLSRHLLGHAADGGCDRRSVARLAQERLDPAFRAARPRAPRSRPGARRGAARPGCRRRS